MKEKKKEKKNVKSKEKKNITPKKNLHPQSLLVIFSPLTWVSVSATQAARITQARSARTAKQPACQPACRSAAPPAGCGGTPVLTRLLQAFKGRRVGPTNSWLAQPFAAVNIRAATADSAASLPGCHPPTKLPSHSAHLACLGWLVGFEAALKRKCMSSTVPTI